MTTLSWILTVVFAFLAGAALTLWLGVWAYKRHVTRIVTTIEEMTKP